MGSEYNESKDNPLHREYGIWSNTVYILKTMWQYKPSVIFLVILGIVCNSVLSYFWGIFGKYVIDIIQLGLSRQEGVGGKTAVYISHRLSSCKFCNKIAVFSGGHIAEYGTHDELIKIPSGIYAEMFEAQAKYYVEESA